MLEHTKNDSFFLLALSVEFFVIATQTQAKMHKLALPFFILVLIIGQIFASEKVDEHWYDNGDAVDLIVDRVWPKGNPSETYYYYYLPFCPLNEDNNAVSQGLSADVSGSRKLKLDYHLKFFTAFDNADLCTQQLSKEQVAKFRQAVENDFHILMYYGTWFSNIIYKKDGLPVVVPVGTVEAGRVFLFSHINFFMRYNDHRVCIHIFFKIIFAGDSN